MKISSKQLIHLPVITESGQELGTVGHFDVDVESHVISHYYIASDHIIKRFLKWERDLMITPQQVVSMSESQMVVQNTVLKEVELQKIKISSQRKPTAAGTSMISSE